MAKRARGSTFTPAVSAQSAQPAASVRPATPPTQVTPRRPLLPPPYGMMPRPIKVFFNPGGAR